MREKARSNYHLRAAISWAFCLIGFIGIASAMTTIVLLDNWQDHLPPIIAATLSSVVATYSSFRPQFRAKYHVWRWHWEHTGDGEDFLLQIHLSERPNDQVRIISTSVNGFIPEQIQHDDSDCARENWIGYLCLARGVPANLSYTEFFLQYEDTDTGAVHDITIPVSFAEANGHE